MGGDRDGGCTVKEKSLAAGKIKGRRAAVGKDIFIFFFISLFFITEIADILKSNKLICLRPRYLI
jgi:hypothetical protein